MDRRERLAYMRKRKRRQAILRKTMRIVIPVILAGVILSFFLLFVNKNRKTNQSDSLDQIGETIEETIEEKIEDTIDETIEDTGALQIATMSDESIEQEDFFIPVPDENTIHYQDEIVSEYIVLVDADTGKILAEKNANVRMNPASMTKVMTVLVASEHVTNWDDFVTIDREITDYCYKNDCSAVGFSVDEKVPLRDLFYGTILPSGADAGMALANYVASDSAHFVELMNEKLARLGISDHAHFTNLVGIYDENHYCTVTDMAIIMKQAMQNEFLHEVLSAHTYTTWNTEQHPKGITISNWFLRRIEDKDCGGIVTCAKTGYVVQSGNCAVSSADINGHHLILVTGNATSNWRCIYDHVDIYKQFSQIL